MWIRLWNQILFLFRRDRFDQELNEELEFHREMLESDQTQGGHDHEAAAAMARRQLGNTVVAKEDARASWVLGGPRLRAPVSAPWPAAMLTDMRDALRNLRVARNTTALALAILTLGITAGTVTFSVVDAVALRRLPFQSPERLVAIARVWTNAPEPGPTAPQDYFAWRESVPAFEALAAALPGGLRLLMDGEAQSTTLVCPRVTANFFDVLGVRPLLGHGFTPDHERNGNDAVVVLSYDAWMRRFGGNANIVGQRVTFAQKSREVIGVMPRGFSYLVGATPAEAWVPYVPTSDERSYAHPSRTYTMKVVGRLRANATIDQARVQIDQVNAAMAKDFPRTVGLSGRYVTMPLQDFVVGRAKPWLLLLLVAVGLVLLVSCVNVANLLLARATVRRRELATREALGASRARLARTLLYEGLFLSLAATIAGISMSFWGVAVAKSLLPQGLARASDIAVDARVLVVSITAAVLCGLAFGAAPAWQTSRSDLTTAMKHDGGAVIGGRGRSRWLGVFLVAEVAFVVTLLVATGLVVTSFIRITTTDLGFDRHDVLTFNVSKPLAGIPKDQRDATAEAFRTDVIDRAISVPGVIAAAIVNDGAPLSGGSTQYSVKLPGGVEAHGDDMFELHPVTAGYFKTMGLRLEHGRGFKVSDRADAPLVAVINDTASRRFFGSSDPIGQTIIFRGPTTIVGVVQSVRLQGPEVDLRPELYLPTSQDPNDGGLYGSLVVRAAHITPNLVTRIRDAIAPALGGAKLPEAESVDDWFRKLTADRRFNAGLLSIFGFIAIMIAAIGIYSVMAFGVAQQVRVIGLQIALGASTGRVVGGVFREAARHIAIGTTLGLVGARAISRVFSSLVFGVTTTDVRVYLAVAAALATIGFFAALLPAIRAAHVDPLVALRAE